MISRTATSIPSAQSWNQRRQGSAAVTRKVSAPRRWTVPSSMSLPASSHQGVYSTRPSAQSGTLRVTTRSTSRAASAPLTSYLRSGEMSKSAELLRTA